MNIYDISVKKSDGTEQPLREFMGKVLLVVNSATQCGFTPQYDELKQLHAKYAQQGLVILDFPCNQFGAQAPGSDQEIATFCTLNFDTPYELYAKIDVNGDDQTELFRYLKAQKGFAGFCNESHPLNARLKQMFEQSDPNYLQNDDIKWNFTKFLVDKTGQVVRRFEPVDDLAVIEPIIQSYL